MITRTRAFKLIALIGVLITFVAMEGFDSPDPARGLIGVWESDERDVHIEMFEDNGKFSGKMIWFKCSSEAIMLESTDTENPDENLVNRKLIGLKVVDRLAYLGDHVWDDGKIYDPISGHTYEARIQLTDPNTAIVRGYWKFRWFGRSIKFRRKTSSQLYTN